MASDDRTMKVFRWFQAMMAKAGRKIAFPKDTDPVKTYQYRSIKKFVDQAEKWNLSNEMIVQMLYSVVKHAKRHRLLHKGTALLNMQDVIRISYQELEKSKSQREDLLEELVRCHRFMQVHRGEINDQRGKIPNVIRWYQMGKITPSYLALSKLCVRAISMVPEDQRYDIPTSFQLLQKRTRLLSSSDTKERIASILGSDLFE